MKPLKKLASYLLLFVLVVLLSPVMLVCATAPFNSRTGAATDYSESALRAHPPSPLAAPVTLKVVTYNIADAYGFTTNRRDRLAGIAEIIRELDPDIVGFQEVFIAKDRAFLLDALKETRLKYHVRYPAGTVGNGLLTMSAWPIDESYFLRYEQNNPWWRIWEGDWWAGKGAGLARIRLPEGGYVDFYNTHAQATRGNPDNQVVRFGQMGELADFVNASRTGTAAGFVVGDFNTRMGREDMERLVNEAGLLREMSIDSAIDHIFVISDPRYTFETLDTVPIEGTVQGSRTGIFLSGPPSPSDIWAMHFGPGTETRLSDHIGYMSTVRITPERLANGSSYSASGG